MELGLNLASLAPSAFGPYFGYYANWYSKLRPVVDNHTNYSGKLSLSIKAASGECRPDCDKAEGLLVYKDSWGCHRKL